MSVENLNTSCGEIYDLFVMEDNVDHGTRSQIPEIQRQLRATSGIDSGVRTLPRRLLQGLADNEFGVAILVGTDRVDVVTHVGCRGQAESIKALLRRVAVEGRPAIAADSNVPLKVVLSNRVGGTGVRVEEASNPLVSTIPKATVNGTEPCEATGDRK
jgi:hypothetical protein